MNDPRNTPYTKPWECDCLYNPHGFLEQECFQCEHEPRVYIEYATVLEGVSMYLCAKDGTPCEFETYQEKYGADADGNRYTWVAYTVCRKCGESS